MELEISKASAPETPASVGDMDMILAKIVANIMSIGGIESISSQKYESGMASRLHVSIAPFNEAPVSVRTMGIVIKDAIAQIMAIANLAKIHMKPTDDDMEHMMEVWEQLEKDAKSVNNGSGQDFSCDSVPEEKDDIVMEVK